MIPAAISAPATSEPPLPEDLLIQAARPPHAGVQPVLRSASACIRSRTGGSLGVPVSGIAEFRLMIAPVPARSGQAIEVADGAVSGSEHYAALAPTIAISVEQFFY